MYTISIPSGTIMLDGVVVAPESADWLLYRAFLQAGGGPVQIPDPVPEFPRITVSSYAVMLAASDAGLADQIESMAMTSGDAKMRIGFMHANEWHSDCHAVQEVRAAIGLSEQAAYDLFVTAQAWTNAQQQFGMMAQSLVSEF
jgi:hypothetical protein